MDITIGAVVLNATCLTFSIYFLIRNRKVAKCRREVLDKISDLTDADIRLFRSWRWRYDMFDGVSYPRMVYSFWKPVDSFFPPEHPIFKAFTFTDN